MRLVQTREDGEEEDTEGRVELLLESQETGGCSQSGCLSRLWVQVARTGLSRTSTVLPRVLMGVLTVSALQHAAPLPDRAVGCRGCRPQRRTQAGRGRASEDRIGDTDRNGGPRVCTS